MHEIKRYAIALDPTWARRRYERALAGRRVGGSRNEDGTANLAGYDLPVDRVAAACDRFDRLAKAAKQAGHPDPIDHVRADLFLGMTDGTYAGLTDAQILARVLAEANLTQPPPAESTDRQPGHDSSTEDPPTNNPSGHHPTGNHPSGDHPAGADPSGADASGDDPSGGETRPVTTRPVTIRTVTTRRVAVLTPAGVAWWGEVLVGCGCWWGWRLWLGRIRVRVR